MGPNRALEMWCRDRGEGGFGKGGGVNEGMCR